MPSFHRSSAISLVILLAAGGVGRAADDGPRADCTYDPAHERAPREIWRELSSRAEAVAPAAIPASSRRRASQPPVRAPQTFAARNFVDTEIFGKMLKDGVRWTRPAGDEEFLRRVTLDLTGQLPDADAVKAFLADTSAGKRDAMVDTLLASGGFTDRWTMWFGDLVQNVQTATSSIEYAEGRNACYRFIRDSIQSGKPYDQMVRELIAGSGKSYTNGEANYWVRQIQNNGPIQDTYDNLSAATGDKFLGLPLNCLSCHNGLGHLELVNSSLAKKTRQEFWKNAAFFARTSSTSAQVGTTNNREYTVVDNTTGEYRLNTNSGNKTPRAASAGQPTTADPAFMLGGETPKSGETRRVAYARIITANPQFARATVNYVWKDVFGAGIVEPADSHDLLRQDPATLPQGAALQPTHPQLLTQLASSFIASGYNIRELLRTIVTSNAYQLSSRYSEGEWNEAWAPYYARHYPRRLSAEEMLDAITKATGMAASLTATGMPAVPRAMMLPDTLEGGSYRNFLDTFGRGDRDDQQRGGDASVSQALTLLDDTIVTSRIKATASGSTVQKLTKAPADPAAIAEGLYLATLSRYPSAAEKTAAIAYLKSGDLNRKSEDLQFALLNRVEFLCN